MGKVPAPLEAINTERKRTGQEIYLTSDAVASLLGIVPQTVRALARGERGSKRIDPIPSHKVVVGDKVRILFLTSDVRIWQHLHQFAKRRGGRRPVICQHCGKPASKRSSHAKA